MNDTTSPPLVPRGGPKPVSLRVLKGCGCVIWLAALFAIGNFVYALGYHKFDPASLLLIVATLYWGALIGDMKRLHRQPSISETLLDAAASTYRSIPTERAFRLIGCYLPVVVVVIVVIRAETGDRPEMALIVGAPVLLGVGVLLWKGRFEELRFHQAQIARPVGGSLLRVWRRRRG